MQQTSSIIENRIKKNHSKLKNWIKKNKISCYRLYDKDIPEYPYQIDVYNEYFVIWEKGKKLEKEQSHLPALKKDEIIKALKNIFSCDIKNIIFKMRKIQQGKDQYKKERDLNAFFTITENNIHLKVNLYDYLDTGLFLDHRPLREKIQALSHKNLKVLNLFSYTGSISVNAAIKNARVTTVDLSNTYINWAKDNFALNNINLKEHTFITSDVFHFLKETTEKFDLIILDPPSFSNSKKVNSIFDVQRDHVGLIELCMLRLTNEGTLFFSNNHRKFRLNEKITSTYQVKDTSEKTIPIDFRDKRIHQSFEIKF
ncbi:MAG: class I SAM-dependent methyltransferase [Bacteriovoracaceae bacterium]|jgi:23S rRNA (cytosine1962-C5)-methyltransferase/23S rRNA (guanine2445-N2)-methyltransferase / 23S rRNA (guanine2069-N7)-methyltransferase|nr:class I SAM-dependent methyltransferase [Bacteriovoracaceae bacterium]